MTITKLVTVACALIALTLAGDSAARADILDAEDWSNHIEEIQQINNTQQFRRTMNRGFDMMAGAGASGSGGLSPTQQVAGWHVALIVPATPRTTLQRFLKAVPAAGRDQIATYLRRELAAYPAAAARSAFNPRNVADARLLALETAFHAIHPTDPMPFAATFLLDIGLSQQMTQTFNERKLTTRQKQDALDGYIIAWAILLPAIPGAPEYALADDTSRRALVAAAQAFFRRDTGVDPTTMTWQQLPCIGISQAECDVHLAMARSAMTGAR